MRTKVTMLFILFSLTCPFVLLATHNKAGEIRFKQIAPNTLRAWVITYTKASSVAADRDTITLCWGDGFCERLARINGPGNPPQGELIGNDTKKNIYTGTHIYANPGFYTLSMLDPNRNSGIVNVNPPNSDQVQFCIQSKATVFDEDVPNSSPILLETPIDFGILGSPFYHTPNAHDADGDSLVYELAVPLQDVDTEVPNYIPLTFIGAGVENQLFLDAFTGLLTWDSPQFPGEYNIAIKISAYRNGILMEEVIRDMQILVIEALNLAPALLLSENQGVIIEAHIGDMVIIQVEGNVQEPNQTIELTATSGLLTEVENPASFTASPPGEIVTGTFNWLVQENHARQAPYQIVFKLKDDYPDASYAVFGILNYRVSSTSSDQGVAIEQGPILFPNPVRQGQVIRFNNWPGAMHYQLFTANGQLLESGMIHEPVLDMVTLGTGLYVLVLERDGHRLFYSFISLE
ncbi:MAG TPA: T9SS type A sorting domain-containing protein [Saprospiraceae bacterium]|nr:T9SS type A sorting domain-containing protein [Saprospiraceae bacterium]HMQ85171.1 T9SS type A sorting domain-containing protein [Saprospiraceae bacterium]